MSILYTNDDTYVNNKVNLKNISNIYYFSLAVIAICALRLIAIHFIKPPYVNRIYIMLIMLTMLTALFSSIFTKYLINNNLFRLYNITYLAFWVIMLIVLITTSLSTNHNFNVCFSFMIISIIISIIPLFKKLELIIFLILEIISVALIATRISTNNEQILFISAFILLSFLISHIRYKNCLLNLKYKNKLNHAIKLSETDKLTGLLNRRGLDKNIQTLWPHWIRQKTPVALIMIDIDYFKKYNDAFGHSKGDECIKLISRQISKSVRRNTDFAARVGGEEFIICLSGIEVRDAIMWAKSLKSCIESLEIKQSEKNFLPYITISMGVVCKKPYYEENFQNIYNEADRLLYQAKEFGRACIVYNNKCYDKRYLTDYKTFKDNNKQDKRFG